MFHVEHYLKKGKVENMNFRIIIKNAGNCVIYDEIINAKNENEAIIKVMGEVYVSIGDKIEIEEVD